MALGSNNKTTREKAFVNLMKILPFKIFSNKSFPSKFCTAINTFYWLSEIAQSRINFTDILSAFNLVCSKISNSTFFNYFVKSLCREWFCLDKFRIEKFTFLVRKFIRYMSVSFSRKFWMKKAIYFSIDFLANEHLHQITNKNNSTTKCFLEQVNDYYFKELIENCKFRKEQLPNSFIFNDFHTIKQDSNNNIIYKIESELLKLSKDDVIPIKINFFLNNLKNDCKTLLNLDKLKRTKLSLPEQNFLFAMTNKIYRKQFSDDTLNNETNPILFFLKDQKNHENSLRESTEFFLNIKDFKLESY